MKSKKILLGLEHNNDYDYEIDGGILHREDGPAAVRNGRDFFS